MAVKGLEWGNQYAKPDIERLGLFIEMPYMNGKGYVFQKITHDKGKRILGEGPKVKTGKQDCYFDKEFKRIYSGEALKGKNPRRDQTNKKSEYTLYPSRNERMFHHISRELNEILKFCKPPSKVKNVSSRPFMPAGNPKVHSTPGDHYGTFGGRTESFGSKFQPRAKFKHEPRQCLTSPGKMGGPGYANICLNKYPEHKVDRYGVKWTQKAYGKVLNGPMRTTHYPKPFFEPNPFKEDPNRIKPGPVYVKPQEKALKALPPGILIPTGPGKWQGGCHAGCFEPFPEHKPDKYFTIHDLNRPKKHTGGVFYPQSMAGKSYYTSSVINENLSFRMNSNNHATYEPSYINYLVGPKFIR